MKGKIHLFASGNQRTFSFVELTPGKSVDQQIINDKKALLMKQVDRFPGSPYVVFLQLPSKMNEEGFKVKADFYSLQVP